MKPSQEYFESRGLRLAFQAWIPDQVGAVMVIAHGYAEHAERYQHVAAHFNAQDIAVYALDHQGHGRSEGEQALILSFEHLLQDMDSFITLVKGRYPTLKMILLGHSMGGGLALAYVQHYARKIDLLVTSAAYLKDAGGTPAFVVALGRWLAKRFPRLLTVGLDSKLISRDAAVVKAYDEDPLVYSGRVKASTADQLLAIGEHVMANPNQIALPVLVLHGTGDGIASVEGSKQLIELLGSQDKTLRLFDGLYHEILNEPEQGTVLAEISDWLRARL